MKKDKLVYAYVLLTKFKSVNKNANFTLKFRVSFSFWLETLFSEISSLQKKNKKKKTLKATAIGPTTEIITVIPD